jgi:adenine phosphoribosyltransferase
VSEELLQKIRDVPDFPEPGVVFKDITPLLQDRKCLELACDLMARPFVDAQVDLVVGIESRGFIFGPPVALRLAAGFVPARKAGKLPWRTRELRYDLEYGEDVIELHEDAVAPGQRVLLVDDVIATGGTAAATARLVRQMGGQVVGKSFLIELTFLEGRAKLESDDIHTVLSF